MQKKRKAAFYDGYVKAMVKEWRSLSISKEELMNMVTTAIEEGESV